MNIQDLIVFQAVANHESISKAADELNFVQSTVSAKMQKLEAHFQTPLFYRHRYGVSLTSAGKNLQSYAKQIIRLYNEAERDIIYADSPRGLLSIGSMETTAAVRLPMILSTYHERYPEVQLSLKTGSTEDMVKKVLNYELDGAFVAGPIVDVDIIGQAVFAEQLVLVSNDSHFSISDKTSLKKRKLLVFKRGCSYRKLLEEWLHSEGITPQHLMEFGSLEAIIGCVNAGLGITLLPKSVIERFEQQFLLSTYELPENFGQVTTYFIQKKDTVATLALKQFIKLAKKYS